jgi:hypothetical protein
MIVNLDFVIAWSKYFITFTNHEHFPVAVIYFVNCFDVIITVIHCPGNIQTLNLRIQTKDSLFISPHYLVLYIFSQSLIILVTPANFVIARTSTYKSNRTWIFFKKWRKSYNRNTNLTFY